jgi:ABC-2 type transport system ATP-binding protein
MTSPAGSGLAADRMDGRGSCDHLPHMPSTSVSSGTASGRKSVIEVRGLFVRYGRREALADVSLMVEEGEVFGLLGPNGAGKTSLVEVLEGHRRRSAGDVRVLGVDPACGDLKWRARLGVVLQDAHDHADWQVGTLVGEIARCYPHAREPLETLDLVGLADRTRSLVRDLSGGQRRRLDVALGIVGRPALLFLDEPTTGFDPEARRSFWELIESLRDEGVTILLTTHYLEEAERLASRIAVLAAGRVLAIDTPDGLAHRARAASTVGWDEGGARRHEQTPEPEEVVWRLSQRFAGPIPGLEVHRPTLEQAYTTMIEDAA